MQRNTPGEQIEQIKNSILQFGNNDPIAVWGDNNIIVEGHGRYTALQQLGYEEVECIRLDHLSEEERRAYTLAHNKLTMNTGFDMDVLTKELEQLQEMDFDLSLTGFDMDELGSLLETEEETEVTEDEYEVELPEEPKAKLGDIYQLGRHRLMCGDSTSKDDVAMLMNGEKADMVFTDPPYGINIVNDKGKVGAGNLAKNRTYAKVIADDTTEAAKKSYEILKTICDKLVIWGGNYFVDFLDFSDGWIIWDKRCGMNSNNFADGEMAYCSFHTPVRIYRQLWNGMIREGERETRVHPTQKPVKMLGDVLNDFSKENEIVLDVFGGSGSTLIACEQLNRTCYMMELSPQYVDVIIDRWETLTGEKAVLLNVEVS